MKLFHRLPYWFTACLSVLFPILSFSANNYRFVTLNAFLVLVVTSVFSALILALLINRFVHDQAKSALIATLFSITFFSYGHVRIYLVQIDSILKKQYLLFPLTCLIAALLIWRLLRVKTVSPAVLQIFNLVFGIMALFSSTDLVLKMMQEKRIDETVSTSAHQSAGTVYGDAPDVYVLLVDEYARQDALQQIGKFDNSDFIQELQDLNFVVPSCSRSNYYWSIQSMSSMLNLNYINDTTQPQGTVIQTSLVYDQVIHDLKHSLIRTSLEAQGYKTIAFETGFPWSEIRDADTFYRANPDEIQLTPFTGAFLNTTLYSVTDSINNYIRPQMSDAEKDPFSTNSPEFYYTVKMNSFLRLDQITDVAGPKFVFAHILSTHVPYVWDESGTFTATLADTPANYIRQIPYSNARILSIIEHILAYSDQPPIIILLSDHGYRSPSDPLEQGFNNFIAVYGPPEMQSQVYPSITPVNVFRLLYNQLFTETYPLLPDYQFHSEDEKDNSPFTQIMGTCPK